MAKIGIIDRIVNTLPKREFNGERGEKVINFFSKHISVPENRLLIGVTALASQPFIDLYNKDVDEKTRIVSCAKTTAKLVVGTAVGFSVRAGLIKLTSNYSKVDPKASKLRRMFAPSIAQSIPNSDKLHAYRQYQHAMGTLLAVIAMIFANAFVDMTLTRVLTNKLINKFQNTGKNLTNKSLKEVEHES